VSRAELLAVVLNKVACVNDELLSQSPFECIVEFVVLLFIVELQFVFLHFDASSNVFKNAVVLHIIQIIRVVFRMDLLIITWVER
jgi:hypothetical protein